MTESTSRLNETLEGQNPTHLHETDEQCYPQAMSLLSEGQKTHWNRPA